MNDWSFTQLCSLASAAKDTVNSFPPQLRDTIEGQILAQYPDCKLERLKEEEWTPADGEATRTARLRLSRELFPIRRYPQFEDQLNRVAADPVTAILTAVAGDRASRWREHSHPPSSAEAVQAGKEVPGQASDAILPRASPAGPRVHDTADVQVAAGAVAGMGARGVRAEDAGRPGRTHHVIESLARTGRGPAGGEPQARPAAV
ncbi:MAG: hypothetical protein HY000_01615 [Planctomycetes bacterium]|nr:hypothetical protein [Planctomycetota bacterium]